MPAQFAILLFFTFLPKVQLTGIKKQKEMEAMGSFFAFYFSENSKKRMEIVGSYAGGCV